MELIPVLWQSARRWLSHKHSGRLPLLSTSPTVTFAAEEITPLGQYQIMLLGATTQWCPARTWTRDLWIASPFIYHISYYTVFQENQTPKTTVYFHSIYL